MSELHDDVILQKSGKSAAVLWDPFISGARRQAELNFSERMGYADCRLVNCGMAAIYNVLLAETRSCMRIVTSCKSYFETETFFDHFLPSNIDLIRCQDFFKINDCENSVLYIEPYINDPVSGAVVESTDDIKKLCKKYKKVIVDNSLFGPGLSLSSLEVDNLIVIESGVKHYCEDFVFGVIFFSVPVRDLDKSIQTTGTALCSLLVEKFQQHLDAADFTYNQRCIPDIHVDKVISSFFNVNIPSIDNCVAPVIYLVAKPQYAGILDLASIVDLTAKSGYRDIVRAGFGWSKTCMRSYADDGLNQKDGLKYLRISLGCEGVKFILGLLAFLENLCEELYG